VRSISVNLGPRTYTVLVGAGLLAEAGRECARLGLGRKVAVVTQPAVGRHAGTVTESLRAAGFAPSLLEVPDGEAAKSLDEARRLWDVFLANGLDAASCLSLPPDGASIPGYVTCTWTGSSM